MVQEYVKYGWMQGVLLNVTCSITETNMAVTIQEKAKCVILKRTLC
jgi:hypothetical protein